MNLDDYRDRMAASHQAFSLKVTEMLAAYGKTQTVFTDLLRDVDAGFTELKAGQADLKESNEELKRLILEQGAQMREQGEQLRELRARLNGRDA